MRARSPRASTCGASTTATVGISLDETTTDGDVERVWHVFADEGAGAVMAPSSSARPRRLPAALARTSAFLTAPGVQQPPLRDRDAALPARLADKDLALDRTMIPLGSCTMKLNATTEMIPVTWPEFAHLHPFAPEAGGGYRELIERARGAGSRDHRLRRRVAAAERRLAGRVRGPARDPRVSREPRRTAIATCA